MSSSLNQNQRRKKRVAPTTVVAGRSSSNSSAAAANSSTTGSGRPRVASGKTNPRFQFQSSSDEEEGGSDDEVVISKVVPSPARQPTAAKAKAKAKSTASPSTIATTTTKAEYPPSQMMMMNQFTTTQNDIASQQQLQQQESPKKKKRRVQPTSTLYPTRTATPYDDEKEEQEDSAAQETREPEHPEQQQQPAEEGEQEDEEETEDQEQMGDDVVDLDHINTPTTKDLASLCWNCQVTLKMPQSPTKTTPQELKLCWNAMHVHPLLNVPICVVCVNDLAARQNYNNNDQDDEDDADDDDFCHGCASAADGGDDGSLLLFMCDDCPRSFCPTCVAKSNGGGRKGRKAVRRLQKDTEGKWSCPACSPPLPLQQLQESLDSVVKQDDDNDDDNNSRASNSNKRSQEEIIHELELVEEEIQHRQLLAEDPDAIQQRREEIADEIRLEKPNLSQKKLDALVEEEMSAWADLDRKHEIRLADMATSLQDELEGVHGFDLAKVYKEISPTNGQPKKHQPQQAGETGTEQDDANDSDTEIEPEWKKKADAEISKRLQEERKNSRNTVRPSVFSPNVYRFETYEDVEDLMTRPEDERCPGESFRSTQEKPTMEEINMCMELEDNLLQERKITIRKSVDNATDAQDMVWEEKHASQRGAGGVSRVKRDIILGMEQTGGTLNIRSKKKRKQQQQQQLKSPPSPPPAAAAGAVAAAAEHPPLAASTTVVPKNEVFSPPTAAAASGTAAQKAVVDLTDDHPVETVVQKVKPLTSQANNNQAEIKNEGSRATATATTTTKKAHQRLRKSIVFLTVNDDSDDDEDQSNKPTSGKKKSEDEEYYRPSAAEYAESDVILSSPELMQSSSGRVKTIAVSTKLTQFLKPHQKEGVKFMWKNACIDLNIRTKREEEIHEEKEVGGCILAHSMGLGKSLTAITLMYSMLNHPGLQCKDGKGLIHTILLVVPVNTIASWKSEFNKWTSKLQPSVLIYDLAEHNTNSRHILITGWLNGGGVLLVSKDSFQQMVKKHPNLQDPGPDAVFLDEAHQCLSNRNSVTYKALAGIKTARRLLLTGSPFQNNAVEYYRMVHWMRKNVLDASESAFEAMFAKPIAAGMPSDATPAAVADCALKSTQLKNILSPFVHRKDASVLRQSLPPLSQVILHVRQSKMQTNLYRALARHEARYEITSFLKRYHLARPVHNHPACLMMTSKSDDPEENAVEQEESLRGSKPWWTKFVEKRGKEKMLAVSNGPKVVLLLHILTHSIKIGDKVIVFSQCLKTLDYIEHVLQLECWQDHVKSLKQEFPDMRLGGWTKGVDYLRIDGATDPVKRGDLIKQFNRVGEKVQLFLISSKAGGIGITLTAANRVVLFDSHFNPVIMNQALFRCYRFGQTKPVFAYRLLTEGTGEEKVYTRSVNKTGLALRVIDGKNLKSFFTEKELENIEMNDTWAQCDRCEKWRMLKGEAEDDLPEKWYCEMNKNDPVNNNCVASEKDTRWYHTHFQLKKVDLGQVGEANVPSAEHQYAFVGDSTEEEAGANPSDLAGNEALARKDEILSKLVLSDDASDEGKKNKHISKYYFHESLLEEYKDSDTSAAAAPETSADAAAVPDGDLKPAAKATPTPLPPVVAEEREKSNRSAANAKPTASVAAAATAQKSKMKKTGGEASSLPAPPAAAAAGNGIAQKATESKQKATKKRSSKAHQPGKASATNTAGSAAASNSSSAQTAVTKRGSTALSSVEAQQTPKVTKKADSSGSGSAAQTFSLSKCSRSSSKASAAVSSSGKPKPTASAAVKQSPSTRSRSTTLDNGNGSITRFSPRLKSAKPNANEAKNNLMAETKKRKRDKSSGSKSARRRLDASLEGEGEDEAKGKHKSQKQPDSSKSKKNKKKEKAKVTASIIELLSSSDEE